MSVQATENRSSHQFFTPFIGNMASVNLISLAKPKINYVNLVIRALNHKVGRFDIAIDIALLMKLPNYTQSIPHNDEEYISGEKAIGESTGCISLLKPLYTSKVIYSFSITKNENVSYHSY